MELKNKIFYYKITDIKAVMCSFSISFIDEPFRNRSVVSPYFLFLNFYYEYFCSETRNAQR